MINSMETGNTVNKNDWTTKDRACINCKHHKRSWNPFALLHLLIDDGQMHHRCTRGNIWFSTDPVTGKTKKIVRDTSCKYERSNDGGCRGFYWDPKESFLRRKENLFKIVKNTKEG